MASQMKTSYLVFLLLIILSTNCDKIDPNYSYDDFMKHFNRTYQGQQKDLHQAIFNKNYADLVSKIQSGQDLKINNFLDWNDTQKSEFFNYRPNTLGIAPSPRKLQSSLYLSPNSYDWRALGRVTPIKDQQSCGGCWAFASTGQYESLLAIQTNGKIYDLAEQYALECQKTSSYGCNGGYPPAALSLYNSSGIPLETSYPFKYTDSSYYTKLGKPVCTDANKIKLVNQVTNIMHYTNLTTQQIQQDLVNHGPLTVAVYAGHPAFQYVGSSGLINDCPSTGGPDHAVLLVGYNSTHWFIKNSWGTSWGHNGYGYILKSNDCQLHTWVDVMEVNSGNAQTPNLTGYIEYNITMSDSKGDGWNGNIIGFKQDGIIVGTFGENFNNGKSYGPQTIRIKNNVQTQIVVAQKGNYTNEVGFIIKNAAGTVIVNRAAGNSYDVSIIFATFCPTSNCVTPTTVEYTVALVDQYGDGWNGVTLGFRQNTTVQKFGQNFTNGAEYTPTAYTFQKYKSVDIIVSTFGYWTEQIGFVVRNRQGNVVIQRTFGTAFQANSILGTFCPQCINLSPVRVVGNEQLRAEDQKSSQTSTDNSGMLTQKDIQYLQSLEQDNYKRIKGLMIVIIVLAAFAIVLLFTLIVLLCRSQNKNKPYLFEHNNNTHETNRSGATKTQINDEALSSGHQIKKGYQDQGPQYLRPVTVAYRN